MHNIFIETFDRRINLIAEIILPKILQFPNKELDYMAINLLSIIEDQIRLAKSNLFVTLF